MRADAQLVHEATTGRADRCSEAIGAPDVLARTPQQRPQRCAAPQLQPPHLVVVDAADLAVGGPLREQRSRMAEHRRPRGESRLGATPTAGDERRHDLEHGDDELLWQHPGEVEGAVVAGDRTQPVLLAQLVDVAVAEAAHSPSTVARPRVGHDDDAGTREMGTPAQVEVLATGVHRVVEAAERAEQVRPGEQRGARQREDVAHRIVLLLIELADLGHGSELAELVCIGADAVDAVRRVPLHELRADDAAVRANRLLDQQPHRARLERDVVVHQQEEPTRAGHEPQHLVRSATERRSWLARAHERLGQHAGDSCRQLASDAGGVEEEHVERVVILCREAGDHLVEPVAGCVGDDDGHDGRGARTDRVHGEPRLVGEVRTARAPRSCIISKRTLAIVSTPLYDGATAAERWSLST